MITRSGIVKLYNDDKGFGFIREISQNSSDRFPERYFHISNVSQQLALKPGDYVYFQLIKSSRFPDKLEAIDVRLTTANSYTPSGALTLDEAKAADTDVVPTDGGAK
jgi:cold shock CspA family protein